MISGFNGSVFHEDASIAELKSGFKLAWMNNVFRIDGDSSSLEQLISQTLKKYSDEQCPMVWRVGALTTRPERVKKLLEANGLVFSGAAGAMILEKQNRRGSQSLPEFQIERVESGQQIDDWLKPFSQAFDLTPPIIDHFEVCIDRQLGRNPGEAWLIGYVDGTPVSSASYLLDSDVFVIYNVATLPNFRGRGYARRMVETVIEHASKFGDVPIALYSTEMGRPLYESMGFVDLYEMEDYTLEIN